MTASAPLLRRALPLLLLLLTACGGAGEEAVPPAPAGTGSSVAAAPADFTVPANDGFITDTVGILTTEQDAELERMLIDYRAQTSNEVAVLIVDRLGDEDIAMVSVEVLRKWGIGQRDKNNGILMLVAYGDRKIFIATGYGVEGAIPDSVAKRIVEEEILPRFRDGAYYDGILAGVSSIQKSIGGEYSAEAQEESEPLFPLVFVAFFLLFNLLRIFGFVLAKSRSWWLGGVMGGGFGLVVSFLTGFWWTVILLAVAGFIFDYFVSKYGWNPSPRRRRGSGGFWTGGGPWSGGSSGGGFGGFGGGSGGGGGAGGRW